MCTNPSTNSRSTGVRRKDLPGKSVEWRDAIIWPMSRPPGFLPVTSCSSYSGKSCQTVSLQCTCCCPSQLAKTAKIFQRCFREPLYSDQRHQKSAEQLQESMGSACISHLHSSMRAVIISSQTRGQLAKHRPSITPAHSPNHRSGIQERPQYNIQRL